jgi:hypothetical protein
MGYGGLSWAGVGWVGPTGSAQSDWIGFFLFFLKYIFSTKEFQRNSSNSFKALKILTKIPNIPGKILEID